MEHHRAYSRVPFPPQLLALSRQFSRWGIAWGDGDYTPVAVFWSERDRVMARHRLQLAPEDYLAEAWADHLAEEGDDREAQAVRRRMLKRLRDRRRRAALKADQQAPRGMLNTCAMGDAWARGVGVAFAAVGLERAALIPPGVLALAWDI